MKLWSREPVAARKPVGSREGPGSRVAMCLVVAGLLSQGAATAELRAVPISAGKTDAADPAAAVWKTAPGVDLALQRTPPLYSTDAPAGLDIPSVRLQLIEAGGRTFARLEWKDPSRDAAELAKARTDGWQAGGVVAQTEATGRFFDACALMIPAQAGDVFPSLQMGDAAHPVVLYFYDSTRGASVMEASGRGTTRRKSALFPARSLHGGGRWIVVMELPKLQAGTPVSVAVWNGSQQDRDGRKYFSVWHRTR